MPNPAWEKPYAALAAEDELEWRNLQDLTDAVRAFLDPVLAGKLDAAWDPETQNWSQP